jgi:hypothetical protein
MDKIEEIIEEFALSEREVQECRERLHEKEFKDRIYEHNEPYAEVFYDICYRYVNSGILQET